MKAKKIIRILSTLLIVCQLQTNAVAQKIVRFTIPTYLCKGADDTISFGFEAERNVVIGYGTATLGHVERIFLPDGVECNGSCSYLSPVTFTDFRPGDTIASVEDISYVRINMEHSYLGDIYMGITCPNGQKASLMNWAGSGSSSCTSTVPNEHRGWSYTYSNASGGTYLGQAYDYTGSPVCDSTVPNNGPGIGWNYCWSDNTTMGYQYAPQDGLIYRAVNRVGNSIDSSNVVAGTNFYHPDHNFSNLIGCPLNGTWAIEVIDAFSEDNGYIFEWDLALDATLIPIDTESCVVTSYFMEGLNITPVSDSLFAIHAPDSLDHDTSCLYRFAIVTSCGDTIDTTAVITFLASPVSHDTIVACDQYTLNGHQYTNSTEISQHHTSFLGCDSVAVKHLIIHRSQTTPVTEHVLERNLPHTYDGNVFSGPVTDLVFRHIGANGCDSNVIYTLIVDYTLYDTVDITICEDQTPFLWNGLSISSSSTHNVTLTASNGADSVVTLNLTVNPVHNRTVTAEAIENHLPATFEGIEFYHDADTLFRFTNSYGCDSLVHYSLTVHWNQQVNLAQAICDDQLPYQWHGQTFTEADTIVLQLNDRYGADSIVTLALAVNPTRHTSIDTTFCDNTTFTIAGHTYGTSGHYSISLATTDGCDSTIELNLDVLPHNEELFTDILCYGEQYDFDGKTYSLSGTYTHRYTNQYGCDSLLTLILNVLSEDLKADILASPLMVTPDNPYVQLHDNSHYSDSRLWLLDDHTFTERTIAYTFPLSADSLPVTLVAFSPEGCTDTATVTILIDRSALAVPNVFTPGQDKNNRWYPALLDIKSMEVWIYDRQGRLMAHLEGVDAYWDGTNNGTPCPQGTYVYNIKYRSLPRPDMPQALTGTILLIR